MIKFYLTLAKELCKQNPKRTLVSALLIVLAFVAYNIPKSTCFYDVRRHIEQNGTHYYQTYGGRIFEYQNEQKLIQHKGDQLLMLKDMNDFAIFLSILIGIGIVCIVVSLFIEDSEMEWALRETIKRNIKEHIVDGEYFYVAYSRIILRKKSQISSYHSHTQISLGEFLHLPIFQTKADIRDKKLAKIGL